MRINKFVAAATGLSRRAADDAIQADRVQLNQKPAQLGDSVNSNDQVTLDGQNITLPAQTSTVMLNKPIGYVCSRQGQGSQTIYDLLPSEYRALKPAGRLDKDSSGLIILTNDGDLANQLTHPRNAKTKIYAIWLDNPLRPLHQQLINDSGIRLEDGPSRLALTKLDSDGLAWQVTMSQGRNRQIRRTFAALGYEVIKLHRQVVGPYKLADLADGQFKAI